MRSLKLILAGFLALPSLAPALEFKPAARFNAQGAYSSMPPRSSWGGSGELFLIPALANGDWTLLPLVAALGRSSERSIAEDSFFVESYTFMAKPKLQWKPGSLAYQLWGGAKRAINKETVNEIWSLGLYDYEEFGLGLGLKGGASSRWLKDWGLGLEMLHRTYVNFHENGTKVVGGKNYYSKDYDGWKLQLDGASDPGLALPYQVGYTLLLRNYTDNYLVKRDGTLNLGALRQEQLHRLDVSVQGALARSLGWSGSVGFDWNLSNQHFFETVGPVPTFNEDFYGYHAESLGLALTWMPWGPKKPSVTPRGDLTWRNYSGRRIRNADGAFTEGKQADFEQRFGLDGRWPLAGWLALTAGADYLNVQSNQGYVLRAKNSFEVFKARLGADLSY